MENKRQFFRVTIYESPLIIFKDGKEYKGEMHDISGNGINFQSKIEWEENDELTVRFTIKQQTFQFDARIVRKDYGTLGRNQYACQFLRQRNKDQSALSALLLRIEADRKKNKRN